MTSGNDQRLKLWSVNIDSARNSTDAVNLILLRDVYTAVADLSCLAAFPCGNDDNDNEHDRYDLGVKNRVVMCGVGMDMWSFSSQLD